MNPFSFLAAKSAAGEATELLNTIKGYIPKVFDFAVNIVIALVLLFVGKIIIKFIMNTFYKIQWNFCYFFTPITRSKSTFRNLTIRPFFSLLISWKRRVL